jgi:hypothetical protein
MSDAIYLRAQAARCYRLAEGPVSPRFVEELEQLGRAFEQEAIEIEVRLLHRSAQQSTIVSQRYIEAAEIAEPV